MIVDDVVRDLGSSVRQILVALRNRITAAENWGPEGKKLQVLTSNGDTENDPPPSFQNLADILGGITGENAPGLVGPQGPVGATGPQGEPGSGLDATHAWQPMTMVVAGIVDLVYIDDELVMIYAPL